METMRDDELSLMIIEKEVKIKKRGKRTKGNENVVLVVQLLLCRVAITSAISFAFISSSDNRYIARDYVSI